MRAPRRSQPASRQTSLLKSWDPWEPGLVALALFLLLVASFVPWWGFQEDRSRPPFTSFEGVDVGPWMAEEWVYRVSAAGAYRRGEALFWWELAGDEPEYAGYVSFAPILLGLWGASLGLGLIALAARFRPGGRMGGLPSVAEGAAAAFSGAVVVAAFLGFPEAMGFSSFQGSAMALAWGPKIGWFLAAGASGLFSVATWLGWRTDRSLRGLCWKCFQEVRGDVCPHCGASQ